MRRHGGGRFRRQEAVIVRDLADGIPEQAAYGNYQREDALTATGVSLRA